MMNCLPLSEPGSYTPVPLDTRIRNRRKVFIIISMSNWLKSSADRLLLGDSGFVAGAPLTDEGDEHRHGSAVHFVGIPVVADQGSFLELDRQQDVSCRSDREEQMCERHHWRHPECEEPADVERVSHKAVWSRSHELHGLIGSSQQVQPDLTQTEQVEVVDQERRDKHQSPAESE